MKTLRAILVDRASDEKWIAPPFGEWTKGIDRCAYLKAHPEGDLPYE
jgi:hypothetical protein